MSARFIRAGLRFYPSAILVGAVLMLVAPVDVVRVLCAASLACAAAGFALHLYALRVSDPAALGALQKRFGATMHYLRGAGSRAFATTGEAAETVWPCVLR
jgi:hypothetical protein